MELGAGSQIPETFRSIPGGVFPMYFVFKAIGDFNGGEVIQCRSSDSMVLSSLILRKNKCGRILIANHTEEPQHVRLLGVGQPAIYRLLDETNAEYAMSDPEAFLAQPAHRHPSKKGFLEVDLLPYAIGWIDISNDLQ